MSVYAHGTNRRKGDHIVMCTGGGDEEIDGCDMEK